MTKIMQDLRSQTAPGAGSLDVLQKWKISSLPGIGLRAVAWCQVVIIHWLFMMSCLFPSPQFKKCEHGTDKTPKMTVNFYHLTSHNGQF